MPNMNLLLFILNEIYEEILLIPLVYAQNKLMCQKRSEMEATTLSMRPQLLCLRHHFCWRLLTTPRSCSSSSARLSCSLRGDPARVSHYTIHITIWRPVS